MEELNRIRFGRLDKIARIVLHGGYGGFLQTFGDLWLKADRSNKAILEAAWRGLIQKYGLEKELKEEAEVE